MTQCALRDSRNGSGAYDGADPQGANLTVTIDNLDASARRTILIIPIVHSPADMGELGHSVQRIKIEKYGADRPREQAAAIDRMWAELRTTVEAWDLEWPSVRLYQDGLPVCGREAPIVEELAKAGSANHQLLLSLMAKGAALMGTEAPDLLLEEYRLARLIYAAGDASTAARLEATYRTQSLSLLARRDRYIATRINGTLLPGEVGLLFLGLLHRVESTLADDICVRRPRMA